MTRRFDAHIHLFENGWRDTGMPGAELERYELLRAEHDIEHALVVGYEGEPRFRGNNDYVLGLAGRLDWASALMHLDPARPMSVVQAEHVLDAGAAGFSIYLGDDGTRFDAFDKQLWALLDERAALLSINATPRALAGSTARLCGFNGTSVLISHLGLPGPGTGAADELVALSSSPGIFVKFSGLYAVDPHFPHDATRDLVGALLNGFGAERMLWGSDYAVGLDVLGLDELFALPRWFTDTLTADERAQLLGGTLRRLCGKD